MVFTIYVNGAPINLESNISVLQACEMAHVLIPRFCYHERLSVAGNCRMCLVEIDKMPKLQVSCSIPIVPNMIIKTESAAVKKAREGVLEFLLVNHPLDCPICDQGGECDLQDQSLTYGSDKSRFKEFKRATEDKDCGPLIKTVMTRCIHCTRCIRFASEIIGLPVLGTSGRGNSLEIGTYIYKMFASELSGNVIDLCPVGALTSKPYAFLSRPWELNSIESIDIFDSIHSNIRVDTRSYSIMRVLPRLNESINEEWISDKIRFSFDGLFVQRVVTPLIKNKKGSFDPISWGEALNLLVKQMINKNAEFNNLVFLVGNSCDVESLTFIRNIVFLTNAKLVNSSFEGFLNADYEIFYKFNTFFKNLTKADLCLLVGINPKIEGVILNYHLRKRYLLGNFVVGFIGSQLKLTFPSTFLGNSFNVLFSILEGVHSFCRLLRRSKKPVIILGRSFQSYLKDYNLDLIFDILRRNNSFVTKSWNGLNCFNNYTTSFLYHSLSLNHFSYVFKNNIDLLYVVESDRELSNLVDYNFMVFQGHHGGANAQKANLILPSSVFLEKKSLYVSCEGFFQYSQSAIPSLGLSKPSSLVLSAIFNEFFIYRHPKSESVPRFEAIIKHLIPFFNIVDNEHFSSFFNIVGPLYSKIKVQNCYISSSLFDNFYQTDAITKCSTNMSKASKYLLDKNPFNC